MEETVHRFADVVNSTHVEIRPILYPNKDALTSNLYASRDLPGAQTAATPPSSNLYTRRHPPLQIR